MTNIAFDQTYRTYAETFGNHPYAAHGGLVLLSEADTGRLTGFHSAVTGGGLQCTITFRFEEAERQALEADYPEFVAWCSDYAQSAKADPVPHDKLVQLGLAGADRP